MPDSPDTADADSDHGTGAAPFVAVGAAALAVWLWHRHRGRDDDDDRSNAAAAAPPPLPWQSGFAVASAPAAISSPTSPAGSPVATSPLTPAPKPSAGTTAPTPTRNGPTEPIPRTFDPMFAREGLGLPVAYLRALAAHESDLNPAAATGPAWGLLQIVEIVRRDYNERRGANHPRAELLIADVNVRIAADALATIADSYRTNHHAPNLHEDWQNPRFVELLTFGWNAGWSERAGVGRVARYLESSNVEVTIESVHAAARFVGAASALSNDAKVAYCRAVTATYLRERNRDAHDGYAISSTGQPVLITPATGAGPAVVLAPVHDEHPAPLVKVAPAPATAPPSASVAPPTTTAAATSTTSTDPHEMQMPPMIFDAKTTAANTAHENQHADTCPASCRHPSHADAPVSSPSH